MTDDLAAWFRGRREQQALDEAMTDEQRAERDRRRQILGSLDDTHALNRSEQDR